MGFTVTIVADIGDIGSVSSGINHNDGYSKNDRPESGRMIVNYIVG
jgi:hypothetical protein